MFCANISIQMFHLMVIATLRVGTIIPIIKVKNTVTEKSHTDVKLNFDFRFSDSKFTDISIIPSHLLFFPMDPISKDNLKIHSLGCLGC